MAKPNTWMGSEKASYKIATISNPAWHLPVTIQQEPGAL